MSDLDAKLRGLRDELNAAIPLPDVERVTGRARTRRRTQLGAIMAVIVVALAVPVLRTLADQEAAEPSPRNTSYLLDFADPDHGYALARTCVTGTEGCRYTLYRTADGGESWEPRDLPSPQEEETTYYGASLFVLGPDEVTIQRPRGNDADRIYSTDGGRSWGVNAMMDAVAASGDTAPLARGSLMVGACGGTPHKGPGCETLGSIEPRTGSFRALPAQPPLTDLRIGSVATESGRWWVTGQDRKTHNGGISVSADDGRTWSTSDLGFGASPTTVVERDGVMYAFGFNTDMQTNDYGLGVWSSDDGGQSWDLMGISPLPGPPGQYFVLGTPVAAADGSITVSDGSWTYVSTNMGRTFVSAGEAVGGVKWTRAGYLRMNADEFALSTDGLSWRKFTVR